MRPTGSGPRSTETADATRAATHSTTTHRQFGDNSRPSGNTSGIPISTTRNGTVVPMLLTRLAMATSPTGTAPRSLANVTTELKLTCVARITPDIISSGPTTL